MKKLNASIINWILLANISLVAAQDIPNSHQNNQRISNPDFVVESNGKQIEVMPDQRAHTTKRHDRHTRIAADKNESFTPTQLGVVIDHGTGIEYAATGEITFKLKSGVSSDAINSLNLPNSLLVMKPDIYVVKSINPGQLVSIARQLGKSPIIEWSEIFTVRTNLK
jgi:hypothetical protein